MKDMRSRKQTTGGSGRSVKNTLFDLILMDVRMTEMDGIEALEEIKRISPGLPVLMMTAYPEVPVAVKAMKLGAWDYLTKPLDTDELRLRIAKLLGGAPAKEEQPPILPVKATNLIGKSRNMKQGAGKHRAGCVD
jgi:two-component system response regulator HydG